MEPPEILRQNSLFRPQGYPQIPQTGSGRTFSPTGVPPPHGFRVGASVGNHPGLMGFMSIPGFGYHRGHGLGGGYDQHHLLTGVTTTPYASPRDAVWGRGTPASAHNIRPKEPGSSDVNPHAGYPRPVPLHGRARPSDWHLAQ